MEAVVFQDIDRVRALLQQGAHPNDEYYWSNKLIPPLHTACRDGNLAIVKTLVVAGADYNRRDPVDSRSPLSYAVINLHKDIIHHLVEDLKCANDDGE